MKIGILTITPNIGYGGIMQSYALAEAIKKITNTDVEIINKQRPITIRQHISFFLKKLYLLIVKREYAKLTHSGDYKYRSKNTSVFLKKYLNMSKDVRTSEQLTELINKNYNAVIVGSDQVWRPRYVHNITDYFLKGIDRNIIKIAYAASFGTDEKEYTPSQIEDCKNEIKDFAYVSVRENSAKTLVHEYFGIDPFVDLDPTFLLSTDEYYNLFEDKQPKGNLFTYILNANDDKLNLIDMVAGHLSIPVCHFNTNAENRRAKLKDRIAPPVSDWLSGIKNSVFVVTDSFHGCVFSIIFNKPFLVYGNKLRGLARFESLLSLFGLRERLVCSSQDFDPVVLTKDVEWSEVNRIIQERRSETIIRLNNIFAR